MTTWTAPEQQLGTPLESAHPMDSSRLLLGLIALSDQANAGGTSEAIDRLIPRGVARRLISALHHRDPSIVRHSRRVAVISTGIARSFGWDEGQLMRLEMAALLHDLGKIGIPDQILLKPGRFSHEESDTAAIFHRVAVNVLQACGADHDLLQIVGQLHTHYNRAVDEGVPHGMEVHQGARILAVADAYDALTNERPHRPAFAHTEAMKHLTEQAGSRFDGNIVNALTRWFESEGYAQLVTEKPDSNAATERHSLQDQDVREAYFFSNMFIYLNLLETTYDAFYVFDANGTCRLWNMGASELFGVAASDVLNNQWSASRLRLCSAADNRIIDDDASPLMQVLRDGRPSIASLKLKRGKDHYAEIEVQTVPLRSFSGAVQGVLEIVRDDSRETKRGGEYRDLKLKVNKDPLTSLANRSLLESQLKEIHDASEQGASPYSVIFIDVDHFKSVNDEHGHAVGDKVLIDLANFLQHETYSGEIVARYGGEEFVLVCPETDISQAYTRAERLRKSLAKTEIGGLTVTASFGAAQFNNGQSSDEVVQRADKALYKAKETGRNKTCCDGIEDNAHVSTVVDQSAESKQQTKIKPFRYESTLVTCMAANIVSYKLSGFVDDLNAKVTKASEGGCTIKVGSGMLGDGEVPVKVDIQFGREVENRRGNRQATSKSIEINVVITPTGWSRNQEKFAARCNQIIRSLRSYLLIDDTSTV